jgi:tetratricopeptide (TPR) repeat protein
MWSYRATITGDPVPHELWAETDSGTRMATALRIAIGYVWMHVFPWTLSADYWTGSTPIVGWGNPMVLLSLLVMAGLVAVVILWRKKHASIAWGIAFFLLTLLPVSNFLFAAGFLKAERVLYIPSIGLIIALASGLVLLRSSVKLQPAFLGLAALLAVFYAGRTYARTMDWKNNFTLAQATLKTDPDSPRFNNMMGLELRAQQKNQEALVFFEKSIQSNPNHVPALVNLGTEYRNLNRLPEAAATLEKALEIDPNTLATYVNLMSVYRSMENYDKNVEIAVKAMNRYPQSAAVMWNAANAFQLKGDMARANELRAQAQALDPNIGKGK